MTRRLPLPKITECVDNRREVDGGVTRGQLIRACYPFFVVGALCLAHVHLQFARADMKMQESQLQGQQRVLQRRMAVLERQSHAIDIEQLRMRAKRELDMRELDNPTSQLIAKIPASVQAKYSEPLAIESRDVLVAELEQADQQPAGFKGDVMSLFESGRAMASVVTSKRP